VTTASGAVYQARGLCCSVPLGVLKAGSIRFEPPLPAAKQRAIETLGMGLLDKIVLLFPERFWDARGWLRNDGPEPGLWSEWVDLTALIGRPGLMGFNAAEVARRVARQSDAAIVSSALAQLRRCYPNAVIPEPSAVLLTRWGDDPFALGSYSFAAVGSTNAMRQELGRRWQGMVLAGEATSPAFPATLQGAYLSGQQAAQSLLSLWGA
jgi:monoamine oxidase